jgi:hypothetical protein
MAELRAGGLTPVGAGRDPRRAERAVDLRDPASYRRVLAGAEVVVNASGVEDVALAVAAVEAGAAWVDITATTTYVAALEQLKPPRPVLLSVGLAPGLTNLLAVAAHARRPGPVDIAVLLGAGERHGAAATDWSYQLLGRSFLDPAAGRAVRNYTQPRSFDLPGYGRRRLLRVDFSDQHTLARDLGVSVRTYFGLDARLATAALSLLTWLPGAARAPRGLHFPGTDGWLVLARTGDAAVRWARGRSQSHATAVIAALAAGAVTRLPPGVHHLHQVYELADLPADRGIELGMD